MAYDEQHGVKSKTCWRWLIGGLDGLAGMMETLSKECEPDRQELVDIREIIERIERLL